MHTVSICSGQASHLSVAHVQLVSQGRVLRLCISQRGRHSKASSSNPCERCLAQADSTPEPLHKLDWCLQTRALCSGAAVHHIVRSFGSCNVTSRLVLRNVTSSGWSSAQEQARAPARSSAMPIRSGACQQSCHDRAL